jgi:hypothetical protein
MHWTVYLDESGTHDSPILVMGGAAAMADQWHDFNKKWEAILEREHLPYIHYVDMVGRRKLYRKYSTPQVKNIGTELANIALSTIPLTVSAILRLDDYHSIYNVESTRRLNRNSPLGILFRATASFLPSFIVDTGLDDRPVIDFVYEAGATNAGDIRQLYRLLKTETPPEWGERLGTLTFVEKGRARGLEMADGVSFASLRLEREEHGSSPTVIEISSHTMPDGARPPANGTIPFRLPISRRNLTDLKDNLLITRGKRSASGILGD